MVKRYASLSVMAFVSWVVCTAQISNPGELVGQTDIHNPIKFAMPILIVAPDARAGGLGDIGVATSPTANAQNWNAAKYTFIESEGGAGISYIPWLRNVGASNINLLYLTGYYKFDNKNSIAAGLRYFSVGSLEFRNSANQYLQTSNPNEWALDFSYARLLGENFSMSLTARFLRSDLAGGYRDDRNVRSKPANAIAADLGLYYNKPIFIGAKTGTLAIGAAITNIGSKMTYSPTGDDERSYFLPTTLRIGTELLTNLNYYHDLAFGLELSKYLIPTPPVRDNTTGAVVQGKDDNVGILKGLVQSFYDAPGGFSEEMQEIMFGISAEYTYARQFMLRAGYYYDYKGVNRKYFTIGAGLRYQMFTLDLAYLIPTVSGFSNPLANTIRMTLSVDFGKVPRSRQANVPKSNDFLKY
jgi:hypothetical protein